MIGIFDILDGVARGLWASAWGRHIEETRCTSMQGLDLYEAAPPAPFLATELAGRLLREIEEANGGQTIGWLHLVALVADGYPRALLVDDAAVLDVDEEDAEERFGLFLALMALGSGSSWFDDHAHFDLTVPKHDAAGDLEEPLMEEVAHACAECRRRTKRPR